MFEKYRSRKWILTVAVLLATFILVLVGKLTAEASQVFTALVVSYNAFQGFIDWQQSRK